MLSLISVTSCFQMSVSWKHKHRQSLFDMIPDRIDSFLDFHFYNIFINKMSTTKPTL